MTGVTKVSIDEWSTPENLAVISGWAMSGLTVEDIAHNIGISKYTIYEWMKKNANIANALKNGRDVADQKIVNALFSNAKGFFYMEEQLIKCKEVYYDAQGRRCEKETPTTATIKRYVPPDTTAQIFWLKNRQRDRWTDQTTNDMANKFIEAVTSVAMQNKSTHNTNSALQE